MRLRNLFEEKVSEVAIIFGRFNPPHKGHKAAWETAATKNVWYVGTNQSTVGPKDPLPYDVKAECMRIIWPEVSSHIVPETSWLTLASYVYQKHGAVKLIIVTDEEWVVPTVQEYNGKSGPHGEYNFPEIRLFHDSIEEAKGELRKSSATALRDAVSKGDRQGFSDAAGVSAETPVMGKPFFDLVAEYLMPYQDKAKAKADKAKAKSDKEKKKEEPKEKEEPKKEKESSKEKSDMKIKDIAEGMNAYDRDYASSISGMNKKDSFAYQQDGGGNDEDHEGDRRREREAEQGPWYLRIDGKIFKSKGEVKVFDQKKGANNYALAILKSKPELKGKIMLTKSPEDK
jgi:hypothetical protein